MIGFKRCYATILEESGTCPLIALAHLPGEVLLLLIAQWLAKVAAIVSQGGKGAREPDQLSVALPGGQLSPGPARSRWPH